MKKIYDKPIQIFWKQRHHFAEKVQYNQSYGFSSCHGWMWHLDHKKWWLMKNWWFWTVVLDKTLEHPLDCKEIQSVKPKGNQSWIFNGRTNAEIEPPILWPMDVKNWLIIKDPVTGKDWRQEEKRTREDRYLDGITDVMDISLPNFQVLVKNSKPSINAIVSKILKCLQTVKGIIYKNLKISSIQRIKVITSTIQFKISI